MLKKLLLTLALCTVVATSLVGGIAFTNPEPTEIVITPRSDIIEWRYQFQNGKLYMRQWNVSRKVWIGNWILCN